VVGVDLAVVMVVGFFVVVVVRFVVVIVVGFVVVVVVVVVVVGAKKIIGILNLRINFPLCSSYIWTSYCIGNGL